MNPTTRAWIEDWIRGLSHRIDQDRTAAYRPGKGNAANARKTHCPDGHPFAGDNLLPRSDGGRRCRICTTRAARERMRRWRARKVAA